MRVDNSTGKVNVWYDKFSSKVHRVHMELGGKLLLSLLFDRGQLRETGSTSAAPPATSTATNPRQH